MTTIGITGGIGSGKTTVCQLLKSMGHPVYNADEEAKRLSQTHPLIKKELIALFGEKIFENNSLNKLMLAEKIFNNSDFREKVNNIIHPVVREDIKKWIKSQTSDLVFIEAAILIESGLYKILDKNILVVSPLELRKKRIKKRNNYSEQEINSRINSQLSDDEKIKKIDYIITNNENSGIISQVNCIIKKIKENK